MSQYIPFVQELSDFIKRGVKEEEPFDGFYQMSDFFFKRNTLSRNRPLLFNIYDSLAEYQKRKCIIIPPPFPLIKSCNTLETYKEFMQEYKEELDSVDCSRPKTIIPIFKKIGLKGILILSGLRHTVGSMFSNRKMKKNEEK